MAGAALYPPGRVMQGGCLEELCFVWFSEEERGRRVCVGAGKFCHLTFISLEVSKHHPHLV